jgi:hypothetical protein
MNVRASSLPAVLLGVTALLIAIGLFPADSTSAHTGGNNPDHLSVTIRPGNWTSTTSSTPFGSSQHGELRVLSFGRLLSPPLAAGV